MASSEQRRQQKLAKKRKRENAKKRAAAVAKLAMTDAGMIKAAVKYPITECYVEDILDGGMTSIVVARHSSGGAKVLASFVLDLYCLGIKNCFIRVMPQIEATPIKDNHIAWSPEDTKKMIMDGVAYANALGFSPHKDFNKSFKIFDGIDETLATKELEFGCDGKPMFIAGPFDSPAKCKQIIDTLQKSCGEGNSHFIMPTPGEMDFDEEDGQWDGADFFKD